MSQRDNVIVLLASLLLSGCAQPAASGPAQAPATAQTPAPADPAGSPAATPPHVPPSASDSASGPPVRLPGLPSASGPQVDAPRLQPLPAAVAAAIAALPTRDVLVPADIRRHTLAQDAYVIDLPQPDGRHDYLVADNNGPAFRYWVRTFSGTVPNVTGYLMQLRVPCSELATAADRSDQAQQQCSTPGATVADTGLRAYRVVDGQTPEDITGEFASATIAALRQTRDAYQDKGVGDVFADASRLAQVPVLRWVAETDPEQPLPATAAGAFDHGSQVHAGFIAWDGERFVYRLTVPAAQWPCPPGKPSLCTKDDRFVIPGK